MATSTTDSPHGWQSLLKMLGSVTAVQILGFALLPLLGRLYTKEDYGILGTLMALVGLATLLANGRYEQATMVAPAGGRVRLLQSLGLLINLSLTTLLVILCLLAPTWLASTKYAGLIPYLFIVPLTTLCSALFANLAAGANVYGRYGTISLATLLQGYINNGLKVLCGWLQLGVWGFAVAFNTGMAIAIAIIRWRRPEPQRRSVTLWRMRVAACHYRSFPMFTIGQGAVGMLISNILPLLLPLYYAPGQIGLITMLYMITRRPVQVYSDTTSRLYARRMVEAQAAGQSFAPQIQLVVMRVAALALLLMMVMPWLATPLVRLILGEQWSDLGGIIIWMLPFLLMESLNFIFNFIPDVLRRQSHYLAIQSFRLASEVAFIMLVAPRLDFLDFINAYFAFAACAYALIFGWLYYLAYREGRRLRASTR